MERGDTRIGVYTPEEIEDMLSEGYTRVVRAMWTYIPTGTHIRYYRVGSRECSPDLFEPGGYVRAHSVDPAGERALVLESKRGGNTGDSGYHTWTVKLAGIQTLYKRYPLDAIIELHTIAGSLAQKTSQIEGLTRAVQELNNRLSRLEQILQR